MQKHMQTLSLFVATGKPEAVFHHCFHAPEANALSLFPNMSLEVFCLCIQSLQFPPAVKLNNDVVINVSAKLCAIVIELQLDCRVPVGYSKTPILTLPYIILHFVS